MVLFCCWGSGSSQVEICWCVCDVCVCALCECVCGVCVCSVWVRKGEDENEKNIHVATAHMDGVCTLTYDSSVTPTAGT